jgi:hypothetical protein
MSIPLKSPQRFVATAWDWGISHFPLSLKGGLRFDFSQLYEFGRMALCCLPADFMVSPHIIAGKAADREYHW